MLVASIHFATLSVSSYTQGLLSFQGINTACKGKTSSVQLEMRKILDDYMNEIVASLTHQKRLMGPHEVSYMYYTCILQNSKQLLILIADQQIVFHEKEVWANSQKAETVPVCASFCVYLSANTWRHQQVAAVSLVHPSLPAGAACAGKYLGELKLIFKTIRWPPNTHTL